MRLIVALTLAIGSGCGSDAPPNIGDTDSGPVVTIIHSGGCSVEGQTVACQIVTGENNGITNCFHGFQRCTNGQWGACGAPPPDAGDTSDADTSDVTTSDADMSDAGSDDAAIE